MTLEGRPEDLSSIKMAAGPLSVEDILAKQRIERDSAAKVSFLGPSSPSPRVDIAHLNSPNSSRKNSELNSHLKSVVPKSKSSK